MNPDKPSDSGVPRAEIVISEVLRRGVSVSLALMLAGTALCFLRDADYGLAGGDAQDLARLLAREASFPRSVSWLVDGLAHLRGQTVIVLGVVLLLATPVLRVAVATVVFLLEKDRRYAAITFAVLMLLLASFLMGKSE